jgi:hypothetical protein
MQPAALHPGPVYDTNTVNPIGAGMTNVNFGAQKRFFEYKGERSPGPGRYNTAHFASNSKLVPPGEPITIGTSKRPEIAKSTWVPGPGAYAPKMAAETSGARGMFKNAPGYSVVGAVALHSRAVRLVNVDHTGCHQLFWLSLPGGYQIAYMDLLLLLLPLLLTMPAIINVTVF